MRLSRIAAVSMVAAVLLQTGYFYPRLPRMLATHYDGWGFPDGWASKPNVFALYLGIAILQGALFLVFPRYLLRMPKWFINLPHREHWLAPEYRAASLEFVEIHMRWLGAAALGMGLAVMQLVIRANIQPGMLLDSRTLWALLAAFMAFLVVWLGVFFFRFRTPTPFSPA